MRRRRLAARSLSGPQDDPTSASGISSMSIDRSPLAAMAIELRDRADDLTQGYGAPSDAPSPILVPETARSAAVAIDLWPTTAMRAPGAHIRLAQCHPRTGPVRRRTQGLRSTAGRLPISPVAEVSRADIKATARAEPVRHVGSFDFLRRAQEPRAPGRRLTVASG